jgi:tRNA nucleotidyltransferase (CCA-adding enzyme)
VEDFAFEQLKPFFKEKGYRLYLVGGASRDLLLSRPYVDHDLVTDATPEQVQSFLPFKLDASFAKYGSLRLHINNEEVDITTLRQEGCYVDHRHPSFIKFITEPSIDYARRDFTINALYLDEKYRLLDFCHGKDDLDNKIIRFIGDPKRRIEEDPLRILRAYRFAKSLGFTIEPLTLEAIEQGKVLLQELNPEKVKLEEKKLKEGNK